MILQQAHPEDIKAAIRKQFGSVFAFEDANDLPRKSVSDFLRGRANQRVRDAITKIMPPSLTDLSDDSDTHAAAHRQNVGAK